MPMTCQPCDCTSFCGDDVRVYMGNVLPCAAMERFRLVRALETSRKRIAERAVISDIESEGIQVELGGVLYHDIRPMIDEREVPAEWIDMTSEAIAYALSEGLFEMHPEHRYLLRRVVPE